MNSTYRFLFTGLLLAISQTLMGQEKAEVQTATVVDTIPFELSSHNNISIVAILGGVDTLNLMFHTAANGITLTKKASEKMKSMHWDSESDAGSWGGRATMRYSAYNIIEIGKLQWDSVEVWEDENSGPATDGKFGPNLFEGYVIAIDFDKNLIILYASLPNNVEGYLKMPVLSENGDLFIEGTSSIGGEDYKNKFLLHSGYGSALLYDDKFAEESKIGERIEIIDQKELKDSFGNVIKVNKGTLPLFTIGNITLTDVPVGFFEGKIGRQQMSVMGGDVLKRFNIIIDSNREYIYLKPNQLKDVAYTAF